MSTRFQLLALAAASAAVVGLGTPAVAQTTIKIGELNSYKSQPAFLEPYRRGWELAVEEINAKGGVLGKKLEVVSRDDGANPGEAVRVAEELVTREGVAMIAGTFLSHIGLAVTEFAGKEKVFFLAAEPLTDKITWQNGNKYTFRLRASTYMQVAMLMPAALAAKKKRWAIVYPNYEYGQSATASFNSPGSSWFTTWPVVGNTTRPDVVIHCLRKKLGSRHGSSSSPTTIRLGTVTLRRSVSRS